MAVTLTPDTQKMFFNQTFGHQWTEQHITPLLNAGAIIKTEFTIIHAEFGAIKQSLPLAINTNALMKGKPHPLLDSTKANIHSFIMEFTKDVMKTGLADGLNESLVQTLVGTPSLSDHLKAQLSAHVHKGGGGGFSGVPATPVFSGGGGAGSASNLTWFSSPNGGSGGADGGGAGGSLGLGVGASFEVKIVQKPVELDLTDEEIQAALKVPPFAPAAKKPVKKTKTKPAFPGPVEQVIKLRDAQHVGQKVHGTSGGSIYTVIALNPRVKMACRVQGTGLSFRAEFDNATDSERGALLTLGMKNKGNDYFSMHLDCQKVSPARVVGAFLFDSDIEFDEQINNLKEIS